MIKKQSDDPDVTAAAQQAQQLIANTLTTLPRATTFDYGGHELRIGEYDVCEACTRPIAEAQQARHSLLQQMAALNDETVKEHLNLAAELFRLEAEAAVVRAELHNGFGTEKILNTLLAYQYERRIGDEYQHSHHGGQD